MSALGSLVVKLSLAYAEYTKGLDKSSQDALKFAKGVQDSMDSAKRATNDFLGGVVSGAVAAIASYKSIEAVINGVRESINRLDEISKMSQRIGVAAETLQELAHAGALADVPLEALAVSSKKLSQFMLEAATGGKEQAQVFKAIGVSATDANGALRSSNEVMADVAEYFAGLEDGAVKTALAVKVFGKAGSDLIPLLNGGKQAFKEAAEEAHKFGLVIGDDTLKQAEAFNDNLTRLGMITKGTFNQLAQTALPVLVAFSNAMVAAASDTNSLNQASQQLAKDGTLFEWTKSTLTGLTYVMDAGEGVVRVVKYLGLTIASFIARAVSDFEALGDAASKAFTGDFKGAGEALAAGTTRNRGLINALREDLEATFGDKLMGAKIRDRIKDLKQFGNAAEDVAKKAKPSKALLDALTDPKGPTEAAKAYEKWSDQINKYSAELDAQYNQTTKLTKAEEWLVQLTANNTKETKALTEASRQQMIVDTQSLIVKEKRNAAFEKERKANEEAFKAQLQYTDQLTKLATKAEEDARQEQEATAAIGLSRAAIMERNAARLDEQATITEMAAIRKLDRDLNEYDYELAMRQAKAYRERASAMRQGADAERSADASKAAEEQAKAALAEWTKVNDQIGQSLADALMQGGRSARDYLKGLFRNLVFRPILQWAVAPLSGAVASILSGGAAAGEAGGGTGNISALINTVSAAQKAYQYYSGSLATAYNNFAYGSTGQSLGLSTATVGNNPSAYTAGLTQSGSALQTAGGYAAGIGAGQIAGRAISGGYSAIGGNSGSTAVNVGEVVGGIIGAYFGAPEVGIAIGGAIGGVINRAFGRKAPELVAQGIEGAFSEGDFSGVKFQDIIEKGGWFRSDKNYTVTSELDTELGRALDQGAKAILENARRYTDALGLPGDQMKTVTEKFRVTITDDAAANEKAITEALAKYSDSLIGAFADDLDPFRKAGETLSDTIARVGGTLVSVNEALSQLGVAKLSGNLAGAQNAIDLSSLVGGTDAFTSLASGFYSSFYSETERTQDLVDKLGASFNALGITMPDLSAGADAAKLAYRDLLKGQDLTSDSGRTAFAVLLQLAGAFDAVAQSSDAAAKAAEEQRKAIDSKRLDLDIELLRAQGNETAAVRLEREREIAALRELDPALASVKTMIYAAIDAAQQAAKLKSVFSGIDSVVSDFASGIDLVNYRADRIIGTLTEGGVLGATREGVLSITNAQLLELFKTVGVDGQEAILQAIPMWKQLKQEILDSKIEDLIDGIASSADDLMSAYNELHPAADTLVASWRKNKTAMEELKTALDEIEGTKAVSALDKLRNTIAQRDGLQNVFDSNNATAFDLKVGQGGAQAVDLLKKREAELWKQFASTGSPEIAAAITKTTLDRIKLEGTIEQKALQSEYDARYKAELEIFNLQKDAHAAEREAANNALDSAKRLAEAAKTVTEFLGGLRAGNLSNLSYTGRLDQQKSLFDRSLETGIDPQGQLTAYLQQAQQTYGGATAQYSAIFDAATAAYEEKIGASAAEAQSAVEIAQAQVDALNALGPKLETALVDTSGRQIEALGNINEGIGGKISDLNTSIGDQTKILRDQLAAQEKIIANQEAQITQAGLAYNTLIAQNEAATDSSMRRDVGRYIERAAAE